MQVRQALEEQSFAALNITTAALANIAFKPKCGNGYCETGEASSEGADTCSADCSSLGWCPVAPSDAEVGTADEACGGIGTCHPQERQCDCPVGHTGEACTICEFGFVPRGALCLLSWSFNLIAC